MKIKYALIGCGRISPNHIAASKNYEDRLEIVGICDLVLENAKRLSDNFSLNTTIYTDYKKMLQEQSQSLLRLRPKADIMRRLLWIVSRPVVI